MEEKNIMSNEREGERRHSLVARREFLIGESLTVTDVWRSRMEEGDNVEDFDF